MDILIWVEEQPAMKKLEIAVNSRIFSWKPPQLTMLVRINLLSKGCGKITGGQKMTKMTGEETCLKP